MKKLNEGAYSLIGVDGNAFSVIGYVAKAMRQCGHTQAEIDGYQEDAMSSDYNHLLSTSIEMIEKLNDEKGYEEGHQFTKPELSKEWESCKVKVKNTKSVNENYDKDTMTLPYDAYQVLTYAISDAFIKLWDDYNIEFSKSEGKRWLNEVCRAFDFNKLSIAEVMNENKNLNEEAFIDSDINFAEFYNVKHADYLTPNEKCIYIPNKELENQNLSIDDIKTILKQYSFTTYIINNKDVQIIVSKNDIKDFIKLKKQLSEIFGMRITEFVSKYVYNQTQLKSIL